MHSRAVDILFNARTHRLEVRAMRGLMFHTAASLLLLALVCCQGVLGQGQGGLSEEEMEEILDAHNYYRRTVDPVATNMLKMVGNPFNYYWNPFFNC